MRAHNHGATMDTKDSIRVRKGLLPSPGSLASNEIDLMESATVLCSSEQLGHPIEQLLDGRSGRGATSWTSARANATEEIVIEFDAPEHIARIIFDAEEVHTERTQQVTIETSSDGGQTFRKCLMQEYTFSPRGSTYQREDLSFDLHAVTHLRLIIVPNKGGGGTASLTSVRLFR